MSWRRFLQRVGRQSLVLRLGNPYATTRTLPSVEHFVRSVEDASEGALRVEVVDEWCSPADRSEETTLLAGVANGEIDLGWAGTRAFGKLGLRSLDPLQAPFLIQSYESEAIVCRSDLARELLSDIRAMNLEGIALLGGELRKPFGITRPLVAASDYHGAVIRTHASQVAEETLQALGAVPVLRSKTEMAQGAHATLDGMDLHAEAVAHWGYGGTMTTNVALWPRMLALVASRQTWLSLGADERRILQEAGTLAAEHAASRLSEQARIDEETLAASAVNCVTADANHLAELRDRVAPVYQSLRRDPSAAANLAALEATLAPVPAA